MHMRMSVSQLSKYSFVTFFLSTLEFKVKLPIGLKSKSLSLKLNASVFLYNCFVFWRENSSPDCLENFILTAMF
jgi:hypothetical protein